MWRRTGRSVGTAARFRLLSFGLLGFGLLGWGAASAQDAPAATRRKSPQDAPAASERKNAAEHATVEPDAGAGKAPQAADGKSGNKTATIWPGMKPDGRVLLPNGWTLRPAGRQTRLGDFPVQIAPCPNKPILAVLHAGYGEHEIIMADAKSGRVVSRSTLPRTFAGMAWSPDGKRLFASGGFDDLIYRFDHDEGFLLKRTTFEYPDRKAFLDPRNSKKLQRTPAGLAVSGDGGTLYVSAAFGHSVGRFDAETGKFLGEIRLGAGSYPYGLALDEARGRLYVSLWSHAAVAVVDLEKFQVVDRWKTQEHPNEMLLARGGKVLYVANANRNTVTVVDTVAGKAVETIGTAIDSRAPMGSTPNALALSPDESMLFVANANTNNLAVVNVKTIGASAPLGFVPVGWYPTSVRVSPDGKTLYVANGKGAASAANRGGPMPGFRGAGTTVQYIAGLFRGTLSRIPMPNAKQMAAYSQTVYECSPLRRDDPLAVRGTPPPKDSPIPARLGERSPIQHVVYLLKENRTYDQILGDIRKGNGEPDICLFPEKTTPNHHALVNEFVLLDNFYVESEVSADGHEWTMGAYASDFVERIWPVGYRGDRRVPYPSEGGSVFDVAKKTNGYLWDKAAEKGVSYRSYGEFVHHGRTPDQPGSTRVKSLEGHFDPFFRGFDLNYPDAKRADRFIEELARFEKEGEMPRLVILKLPNDHTSGTAVGKWTVNAYLGDNDLALGRVVEALSHSRFWKSMAIFVVEDDAQNGSDHVDAHRTVAMAISPYVRRHSVDSTMYSTSSMLRTMELILGLEPMSQFDASARPMYASFTGMPDFTPYVHRPANVDLDERNRPGAPLAEASSRLNFEVEDQNDDVLFNEIIWKAVRGKDSIMPPPVRAAFVLPR